MRENVLAMSDSREELERRDRQWFMDSSYLKYKAGEERRVIPDPVIVLKPQAVLEEDRIEISSLGDIMRRLKTPSGQPIDKRMLQRIKRDTPGLLFVVEDVLYVYQEGEEDRVDRLFDQLVKVRPHLSRLRKEDVIDPYIHLLTGAKEKLAAQVVRNQRKPPV